MHEQESRSGCAAAPEPLVPAYLILRAGSALPLDVARLRLSSFARQVDGAAFRAAVFLWATAWQESPAGSLPNDPMALAAAAHLRREPHRWTQIEAQALGGFVLCSDNRWYHPSVCELAIEAFNDQEQRDYDLAEDRLRKENKRRSQRGLTPIPKPARPSGRVFGDAASYLQPPIGEVFRDLVEQFRGIDAGSSLAVRAKSRTSFTTTYLEEGLKITSAPPGPPGRAPFEHGSAAIGGGAQRFEGSVACAPFGGVRTAVPLSLPVESTGMSPEQCPAGFVDVVDSTACAQARAATSAGALSIPLDSTGSDKEHPASFMAIEQSPIKSNTSPCTATACASSLSLPVESTGRVPPDVGVLRPGNSSGPRQPELGTGHTADLFGSPVHREPAPGPRGRHTFADEDLALAKRLYAQVCRVAPSAARKAPHWGKWANQFRLAREVDGHDAAVIGRMLDLVADNHFWHDKILSPETLRRKWQVLEAQFRDALYNKKFERPAPPPSLRPAGSGRPTADVAAALGLDVWLGAAGNAQIVEGGLS